MRDDAQVMRIAPVLHFCALLLPAAAPASGSPALLSGARFEAATQLDLPVEVVFTAPGEVERVEGEARTRCTFTAEGGGYLWALELLCDGVRFRHDWTWLPSGDVWTDLVDVPDGQLRRAPASKVEPASASAVIPVVDVVPAARPPRPPVSFAALAARFQSRDGAPFEVLPDGKVRIGDFTTAARLQTCLHVQVEPHPVVPCLGFEDAAGKPVSFGLLFDFAWVEGVIRPPGEDGALPRYEGFRGGRFYGRVR